MSNPEMPNFPGMGAMTDTLDFVKNLWGSMGIPGMNMPGANAPGMSIPGMNIPGIPGMVMPTLSVEEINKKIADLKAVETWLTLNMNMLRGTIQALEVQAATISTLQTMGETFAATMQAGAAAAKAPNGSSSAASAGHAGAHGSASSASSAASDAGSGEKRKGVPEPTNKDESDAANLTAPLVNAAAWWNMLQDQFKQAVNTAMTETPNSGNETSGKPKAAAKSAGKDKDKTEPTAKASPSARKSKPEK